MPKVHFVNERVTAEVPENTSIRDVAIQQGIEIYRGMWTHINCLGNGICGRCKIWIASEPGKVSDLSVRERFHRIQGSQRLACQVRVVGDVEVHTRPIGPAVVRETSPDFSSLEPSYREAAARRLVEAREEAAKKAAKEKKAAEAKAKAEAEAKAKAEAEAAKEADAAKAADKPADAAKAEDKPAGEPKPAAKQESA